MTIKALASVALGCTAFSLGACATVPAQTTWLAGTAWAVDDVNGTSTAGRSDFTVKFTSNRFEARFGCRRASGNYTVRYLENDPQPIFQGSNATITGTACTGLFAEANGPEILANATFSLTRTSDGRLIMLQPPTGITLRPL